MGVESKEVKFPDTGPVFAALSKAVNILHDAKALATAANRTFECSDQDNHFLGLRVSKKSLEEIERLLKQLDAVERHLIIFNVKYKAVVDILRAET
jgi:Ser/Thr protein kinase RdoA (MazF antagonist)